MHTLSPRCRLLGGIFAVGLVLLVLSGCGGNVSQPTTGASLTLQADVADPTTSTTDDYSLASVKPDNPADAVATLSAPVLSTLDGAAVTSSGSDSNLLVTSDSSAAGGSLPLVQSAGRVMGAKCAVLPKGNSAISLSPGTLIDVSDITLNYPMRLSDYSMQFSVHDGRPPSWTLPSTHKLRMERHRNMYVLAGSYLELRWNGHHSVPPADNTVTITANLYAGATKVAGPLTKTVSIVNNSAIFTSSTNVEFNRVDITIDLRDAKL